MTCLVVVYDKGAASPMEVTAGLGDLGEVVFAVPPSPFNDRIAPLLGEFGEVVPVSPETALEQVKRLRPQAILTFSESRLRLTASLTERLSLPGHSTATATLLTDKYRQRDRLRAAGVDPTRSVRIDGAITWEDAIGEVGLPAVLKPVRGEGSHETRRIDDAAPHLAAHHGMVLEQFLRGRDSGPYGDYVSVESVISRGRITNFAITGKYALLPPFRERGDFWPALLGRGDEDELHTLTSEALTALEVDTGVTHTEVKLTPDGPRIIEVNGRLAGHLNELSTRATGLDVVRLAGQAALGQPVTLPPAKPDAVWFQYFNPAPSFACRLVSSHVAPELRAIPGILDYRRLIQPNTLIEAGVSTNTLDILHGTAPDHEAMMSVIGRALKSITFVFETLTGTVELRADELSR